MASLSISTAWEEGARFAAREFRLLFPIAFLLTVVPGLLVQLVLPADQSVEMARLTQYVQTNGVGPVLAAALFISLLLLVISTFGNMAISYLALRPGTSVAESLGAAGRRLVSVVAAILLVALVLVVPFLALSMLLLPAGSSGSANPAAAGPFLFMMVLTMIALAIVSARLLPLIPAGVAEPLGPIALIRRCWSLTSGYFWRLFGTILLIGIVYVIALGLIGMVIGLIVLATVGSPMATPINPLPNQTAAFIYNLIMSLVGSVAAIFLLCFFARIYAQLAGRTVDVRKVFE